MSAPLALLAPDDPSSWIEIVLVLIFLLGGVARSIARAVKGEPKSGPATKRRSGSPTPAGRRSEGGPMEGLDRWKELLRGEAPAPEAPPPSAAPRPAAPRSMPARKHASTVAVERAPELAHMPSQDAPATGMPEPELAHLPSEDRAVLTEEQLEARRDEVQERVPDTFATDEIGAAAERAGAVAERKRLRDDWRRAIVTAELLGQPVALRGPEGGPVGLRG